MGAKRGFRRVELVVVLVAVGLLLASLPLPFFRHRR